MISINFDFKNSKTELYNNNYLSLFPYKDNISKYHDVLYTAFYHSLFENIKDKNLDIGIFTDYNCISTLLFSEYFKNSNIYTFHNNNDYINYFNIFIWSNDKIKLSNKKCNLLYDIIINNITKNFEEQIKAIENTYQNLKQGGLLIIENIFKEYNEEIYIDRLSFILDKFQKYYFINVNDNKLLILIKNGMPLINKKKMTIITPSARPFNLLKVKDSINFDYVDEWIIVYDENKVKENPQLFKNDIFNHKITEYIYKSHGCSGNPQRNYALDNIKNNNTFLYFLDDDNKIHEDLYNLLDIIGENKLYTFNQKDRINGDCIEVYYIDTAMILIDYNICKNIRWKSDLYNADGHYIKECYLQNTDKWIYINNTLCTYNIL